MASIEAKTFETLAKAEQEEHAAGGAIVVKKRVSREGAFDRLAVCLKLDAVRLRMLEEARLAGTEAYTKLKITHGSSLKYMEWCNVKYPQEVRPETWSSTLVSTAFTLAQAFASEVVVDSLEVDPQWFQRLTSKSSISPQAIALILETDFVDQWAAVLKATGKSVTALSREVRKARTMGQGAAAVAAPAVGGGELAAIRRQIKSVQAKRAAVAAKRAVVADKRAMVAKKRAELAWEADKYGLALIPLVWLCLYI